MEKGAEVFPFASVARRPYGISIKIYGSIQGTRWLRLDREVVR